MEVSAHRVSGQRGKTMTMTNYPDVEEIFSQNLEVG